MVNSSFDDYYNPTLPGINEGEIVVVRSKRRKKNISAFRQNGKIIISIPARMSKADERAMVPVMIAKIRAQEKGISDSQLAQLAMKLLAEYAPEITIRPATVSWREMNERWGSCTSIDRTIRISNKLKTAPEYVLEFVLFHELIHLYIDGHSEDFYQMLNRYPKCKEAEAFLEGYEFGVRIER